MSLNKTDPSLSAITLGSSGLTAANSASMVVSTDSSAIYGLDTIGFGTVYQTNGVATSSYFSNMTQAPV